MLFNLKTQGKVIVIKFSERLPCRGRTKHILGKAYREGERGT